MDRMMPLPTLVGRRVQWNEWDVAEIVAAWAFMEEIHAGPTVVGHAPKTYGVFRLPDGRTVTSDLRGRLLPESVAGVEAAG